MYEVFVTITNDLGSFTVSTGRGGFLEVTAYEQMEELQRRDPEASFHVEWVPMADQWNSY